LRLRLSPGDEIEIASSRAAIRAIVEEDPDLLEGIVAMAYGYGGAPDRDDDVREIGSAPARILSGDRIADPYVGMPQINNIPVRISSAERKARSPSGGACRSMGA
jgi:anaerobic selenocysteine-containing dehydrogenase